MRNIIRLASRARAVQRPSRTFASIPQCRPFSQAPLLRLKEDADRSPEELEKEKQKHLDKQEKGEGEWHEGLASSSESHVKADQENVKDHDEHIEDLQKQTAQESEKEKQ